MNLEHLLRKLPNTRREPPGLEWRIWKKLPLATLASIAIPGFAYLYAYLLPVPAPGETVEKYLNSVQILAIAGSVTLLTAVFTIAIGCFVVRVMKGPGYVADAYPLVDAEQPRETPEGTREGAREGTRHQNNA